MPKLWDETIDTHRRAVRDAVLTTTAALAAAHGPLSVTMSHPASSLPTAYTPSTPPAACHPRPQSAGSSPSHSAGCAPPAPAPSHTATGKISERQVLGHGPTRQVLRFTEPRREPGASGDECHWLPGRSSLAPRGYADEGGCDRSCG